MHISLINVEDSQFYAECVSKIKNRVLVNFLEQIVGFFFYYKIFTVIIKMNTLFYLKGYFNLVTIS